ncbi:MAG: sigma-70 family RNA polymerase sigma factor [Proteobacteria bacterium]|uniref:ECF-type sigma factor n=1 Tax=Rudaea sp. TaxID=2136325 RepID=UPI001DBFD14E|nr:sigma-70 family RNA polymerase sigma factor [Pseudomonadota bacterium]MBS0567629.1 sigma-70 family RNA polymerase sigma factor [Pseudomonadota bacterium]
MADDHEQPITTLLSAMGEGDAQAAEKLFPIVYAQLRQLAQRQLAGEFGQVTLAPTDLVHEAYLKLSGGASLRAADCRHFFTIAARAMRQVLIDRARRREALKRDGGERVSLTPELAVDMRTPLDLLALDQALNQLAEVDARKARAIELRVFAGIGFEQIADTLGVSRATLARDYRGAQAWLYRALSATEPAS